MSNAAFIKPKEGSIVESDNNTYEITHILGLDTFLGKNVRDQTVKKLRLHKLRTISDARSGEPLVQCRDLNDFSDEEIKAAKFRFECIRPLLEDPYRTRKKAEQIALDAGIHVATLYTWMKLFQDDGHLSSLIPQPRGRRSGKTLLSPELERIIEAVIEELYLSRQRFSPTDVIQEVRTQCKIAKVSPPHANTVRARIRKLDHAYVLKRRGRRDKARDLYDPIISKFPGADFPLAVVQIDHTPADVILVDDQSRKPLGRPWLTLAIDVNTRVIVGAYISMDPPSAAAAGMCISRSILTKDGYLQQIGVPGSWPVYGKMRSIHVDNGKEFRGKMLQKSCDEYGIDLQLRPVKTPHYGGHIERYMGVASKLMKKLPGTTFSNPQERKGYDSEKNAALTLREAEQHLIDFIVNVYHKSLHSGINCTPLRKWELGILGENDECGTGLPEIPSDPDKLILDFMPFEERTVQNYGIQLDKVEYYHEVLNKWINAIDPENTKLKRKFIVRRDPRDISKIYFYDPDAQAYYVIPYRDTSHPAISIWELREAQRLLKEEAIRHVDENALFETIMRMRERVEKAVNDTKKARRSNHRKAQAEKVAAQKSPSSAIGVSEVRSPIEAAHSIVASGEDEDDIFSEDIKPFNYRISGLNRG